MNAAPALRCSTCGSPEIVAVRPGAEDVRLAEGFVVTRGEPARLWCRGCWPALKEAGASQEASAA